MSGGKVDSARAQGFPTARGQIWIEPVGKHRDADFNGWSATTGCAGPGTPYHALHPGMTATVTWPGGATIASEFMSERPDVLGISY